MGSIRRGDWRVPLTNLVKTLMHLKRPSAPLTDEEFDREFGTETSLGVRIGALTVVGGNAAAAVEYQPVFRKRFYEIMSTLSIPHEDFVFLDLGAGKGKGLLLASEFAFKRVIGVEFAKELHDISCRNIDIFKRTGRCRSDIVAICADAVDVEFPPEPLIVFLYNPFGPNVLIPVLQKLVQSLSRCPRSAILIYLSPVHSKLVGPQLAGVMVQHFANDHFHIYATHDLDCTSMRPNVPSTR